MPTWPTSRRSAPSARRPRTIRPPDQAGGPGRRQLACAPTDRPLRADHGRQLGDKRTALAYDLGSWTDPSVIDDIVAAEVGATSGPDTPVEARNRGYTLATPGKRRLRRK